jgi:hypothetical protein
MSLFHSTCDVENKTATANISRLIRVQPAYRLQVRVWNSLSYSNHVFRVEQSRLANHISDPQAKDLLQTFSIIFQSHHRIINAKTSSKTKLVFKLLVVQV